MELHIYQHRETKKYKASWIAPGYSYMWGKGKPGDIYWDWIWSVEQGW